MIELWEEIKNAIKRSEKDITEIARKSGVSRSTITKWLSGERDNPTLLSIESVLEVIGYELVIEKKEDRK